MSVPQKVTSGSLFLATILAVSLSGSLAQAIELSRGIVGANPTPARQREAEAEFHYRVALAAMRDGDLTIAARELNEAARLAPSNALVWYNLGIVESNRSNPAAAVQHFQRALQLGLAPAERSSAQDLLAEATYRMMKTGSDVKGVLYGVGFGLMLDQVLSRGEQLGIREASSFGDRYAFTPREDRIGQEREVSLYFGSQGLQRIWANFDGGWADEREVVDRFQAIERLLSSRGFQPYLRTPPPVPLRLDNPLPHGIRFRNGILRADLMTALTLEEFNVLNRFDDRVAVEEMTLVIWDSERCTSCDR